VESTRAGADGVFVDRGAVIVLARSSDWPQGEAREAVRTLVDPVWTKAHLGMTWVESRAGAEVISQLEGLEPIAIAERGRLLFVANDPALLAGVLQGMSRPAAAMPGTYAAGYRHALERDRFVGVMRFIDHLAAPGENREPPFFSGSVASLSETLSRVDSASIVVRDTGRTLSQTVIYRLAR
jgi:hypothetical protein